MKHFMVHESQHPVHEMQKGPKTKKSFQHSQLRQRWQGYKEVHSQKAPGIQGWHLTYPGAKANNSWAAPV